MFQLVFRVIAGFLGVLQVMRHFRQFFHRAQFGLFDLAPGLNQLRAVVLGDFHQLLMMLLHRRGALGLVGGPLFPQCLGQLSRP